MFGDFEEETDRPEVTFKIATSFTLLDLRQRAISPRLASSSLVNSKVQAATTIIKHTACFKWYTSGFLRNMVAQ